MFSHEIMLLNNNNRKHHKSIINNNVNELNINNKIVIRKQLTKRFF